MKPNRKSHSIQVRKLRKACFAALEWCYADSKSKKGSISHLAEVVAPMLEDALESTKP